MILTFCKITLWLLLFGSTIPCLYAEPWRELADPDNPIFTLPLEQLTEINVWSAGKKIEQAQDVPASVTVLTRSEIERMGYTTLDELLAHIPGLHIVDTYNDYNVGVRGVLGVGVIFMVNGVPEHPVETILTLSESRISRFALPVEAIDRIEVVRGPMSVIYGNGAFFGSVNIITNDYTRIDSASASYGSKNTHKAFLRLSKTFENGSILVNSSLYKTDGLIEGDLRTRMSAEQLADLHPLADPILDDKLTRDFQYFDLSAEYKGFTANLRYADSDYSFLLFTPPFGKGNTVSLPTFDASLRHEYKIFHELVLNSSLIYSNNDYDQSLDFLIPDLAGFQFQHSERLEIEFDLSYRYSNAFTLLGGLYYQHILESGNRVVAPDIGLVFDASGDNIITNDLFLQIEYLPMSNLKFVVGGRLSQTHAYTFKDSIGLVPEELLFVSAKQRKGEPIFFVPRLAAVYSLDDRQVAKLLVGQAIKPSLFRDPERITTLEANYSLVMPNFSLSFGLFKNEIEKLPELTQIPTAEGETEVLRDNAGEIDTLGTELIGKWHPFGSGLGIDFSSTWQNSVDSRGATLPFSPKFLHKFKISYQKANFSLGILGSYVGSMKASTALQADGSGLIRVGEKTDSYFTVGFNARYKHSASGLFANLHITNLFNEKITIPASDNINFVEAGAFGPGRDVLFTMGVEL